jgi:flavin-dependent dehydrogenase
MTQRKRLDHFLVEQAVAAGAEFRDGVKVSNLSVREDGISVEAFEGDVLVGADGVNGVTARALGLGGNRVVGVALEGNLPYSKLDRARYDGRLALEIGVVPGGYGWVFPKGDHLNLGVGGWAAQGPLLRDHLATLCDRNGVAADDLSALRGHRLPMRRSWGTTARGRAAVVGDAAGLVDPLSGDGMFEAILSSKLASESALDVLGGRAPGMEPYAHRLRRALAGHAATAWAAKAMLERAPALTWQVLRTPMMRWFVASRLRNATPHRLPGSGALERSARLGLGAEAR